MFEFFSDQDDQSTTTYYQYRIISRQETLVCEPIPNGQQITKTGSVLAQESIQKLTEAVKNLEIKPKQD